MTSPAYPVSLDALANPGATTETDDTGFELDIVVSRLQNIAMAIEGKLGIGPSTPPATAAVLRQTASGASAWGPLTVADVDPLGLAGLTQQNPIINGDFSVWQRGTGLSTGIVVDRWGISNTSAAVPVASQQTTSPPASSSTPLSPFVLSIGFPTADAAVAAGDQLLLDHILEGYTWAPLAQRQFTLSFWVRATKTGKHCVAFVNGGLDRSYVAEYTVNASLIWEYKTITVAASPAMTDGTWYLDHRSGLWVRFVMMAGTSALTATPNTWQTGVFAATAGVVNDADSTSNAFQLAQVKITPGPYAAPFVPRPIAQELALCQRYCEVFAGSPYYLGNGVAMTTTTSMFVIPFKVQKRIVPPAVTFGGAATDFALVYSNLTVAVSAIGSVAPSPFSLNATATAGAALVAGQATMFIGYQAAAKLVVSADLP